MTADSVEAYVVALPLEWRPAFEEVVRRIREVLPAAEETISYQMPTWRIDGEAVVHLAAWKHHLSLYPAPAVTDDLEFEEQFAAHRGDRGTARFAYADPMPFDLIQQMVEQLLAQRTIRR
jgi:uncharacterized protein YdhG (YjbR/CyaY superfamily)